MQKRNTVIVAAVLIIVLGTGYVITRGLNGSGAEAVVEVNGEEFARLKLSEDTEIRVEGDGGAYNLVKVKDGYVFVEEANCGDHICVRTGKINETGRVIACLPHGLIVYVDEKGK